MKSRLFASLALGAAIVLGTTGCAMMATQATSIPYSPADGVNVEDSGPLQVRNVLIVTNDAGDLGNFVAAIVNNTDDDHTLEVELGEGSDTARLSIRVPARSTVSLGDDETEPLLVEGLEFVPGDVIPGYFASGDSEGTLASVPVLDGQLDYLAPLVPTGD